METTSRSVAKALSWRMIATVVTSALALAVTGRWELAATIGLADTALKFFLYFGHERLWNRVPFGRGGRSPAYCIPRSAHEHR